MELDVLTALAADVEALVLLPVDRLPMRDLQAVGATIAPLANRLAGVLSRLVGEIDSRGGGVLADPDGTSCPTPAWLRNVAHVSGRQAGRQVRTAVALRELPLAAEAIVDGEITVEHGRVLARLVGKIEPQALLDSQGELIEVARRTDPEQLAHYVRHLIATWCEPELEADEQDAQNRRFLQIVRGSNGSSRGRFELPDAEIEVVLTALEPLARRDGLSDDRTAGQRRADALVDVFALAVRHADLPDAGGARPRLTYVVSADWAVDLPTGLRRFHVDLDNHPGAGCPTAAWTGPQTRARIETALCDARIERLVIDSTGQVVSLSSLGGEISAGQRRAVAARDRCCTAKGCSRPPAFCDVHHLLARADGGPTAVDNLVLLCRRHHVMWHRRQLGRQDLRLPSNRTTTARAPART